LALPGKRKLIVNFKTYRESSGKNAEKLAKLLDKPGVILAVQNADLHRVSRLVRCPLFAQHVDPVKYGPFTGHDNAFTLKQNGASGVIINHSEDRMKIEDIGEAVKMAKEAKLVSVVCIDVPWLAKRVARYKPDIIAIEPPELIGTGISVSTAKPEVVTKTVKAVPRGIEVLCGAGITTSEDVHKAIKLGCNGVLLASAIVLSRTPGALAKQMLEAMK
jgi:triosephosphate isomerase